MDAIKTALNEYNWCATKLKRATLSWNDVMDMVTLAEFDLLRETREDIRQFPWAQRINRQVMNLYFNVKCAREEIEHLNVEIPQTFTALVDRHYDLQLTIALVHSSDPGLVHELQMRWAYEDKISARITARLYETSQLAGFSGHLVAGKRAGWDIMRTEGVGLPAWACRTPQPRLEETCHGEEESDDDEGDTVLPGADSKREVGLFIDFLDNLGQDT